MENKELDEALKKVTELEATNSKLLEETNSLKTELGDFKTKLSDEEKKYIELGNAFKIEKEVNLRMKEFFDNSKPKKDEPNEAEKKAGAYNFIKDFGKKK